MSEAFARATQHSCISFRRVPSCHATFPHQLNRPRPRFDVQLPTRNPPLRAIKSGPSFVQLPGLERTKGALPSSRYGTVSCVLFSLCWSCDLRCVHISRIQHFSKKFSFCSWVRAESSPIFRQVLSQFESKSQKAQIDKNVRCKNKSHFFGFVEMSEDCQSEVGDMGEFQGLIVEEWN